jgi:glycine cleavage system aminomethyltransferase T
MGYDWMVDLEQKADFIGKQALARIKEQGPSRRLVGVEIDGPGLGSYNDGSMIDVFPVDRGGRRVGQVTSACFSPRLERNIGYAMVPVELADPGTALEVDAPGGRVAARVVTMPFIDPGEGDPESAAHKPASDGTRGSPSERTGHT